MTTTTTTTTSFNDTTPKFFLENQDKYEKSKKSLKYAKC